MPHAVVDPHDGAARRQAGGRAAAASSTTASCRSRSSRRAAWASSRSQHGDLRLGWDSPVKEVVHPKLVNLQARGGLGWLDGFNEWLVRCGLENNGQAGPDKFINNVGDEATMELTLHGKIANIPAQEVEVDRRGPAALSHHHPRHRPRTHAVRAEAGAADGAVDRARARRRSRCATSSSTAAPSRRSSRCCITPTSASRCWRKGPGSLAPLRTRDAVQRQRGAGRQDVQHVSRPDAGLRRAGVSVAAARRRGRQDRWCSCTTTAAIAAASLSYALKELPYLTLWKNTGAEADGYVIGLEPGTNYPNRRVERKAGRVPKLEAGGRYAMTIEYGVHVGKDAVARVVQQIDTIQGDRGTKLNPRPRKSIESRMA